VLGSQVGGGTGNKAATAVGGIAGAVIGDRVANPDQPRTEQVERCREVADSREVLKGYDVTYRYQGQDFTTRLPYKPGSTLRVGVAVSVLGDNVPARIAASPQRRQRIRLSQGIALPRQLMLAVVT